MTESLLMKDCLGIYDGLFINSCCIGRPTAEVDLLNGGINARFSSEDILKLSRVGLPPLEHFWGYLGRGDRLLGRGDRMRPRIDRFEKRVDQAPNLNIGV